MADKNEDDWGLAASAEGPDYKELKDRLLVFRPEKFEKDVQTVNGKKNAVVADVFVIDEKTKRVERHIRQTMIFPASLTMQLRTNINRFVPGVLIMGKAKTDEDGKVKIDDDGKPYAPPWEIRDPDALQMQVAKAAIRSFKP